MNKQFQVAQASGTGNSNNASPERIFTLTKPLADQSVVINVGYDQKVKVDFSGIAQEKITLVHIGEKLIILFDNQSTVTIEPFFDSRHDALGNLSIEVSPGRDLSVSEFASSFPITTDQSVLPAAGTEGNAQASGANFLPPLPTRCRLSQPIFWPLRKDTPYPIYAGHPTGHSDQPNTAGRRPRQLQPGQDCRWRWMRASSRSSDRKWLSRVRRHRISLRRILRLHSR